MVIVVSLALKQGMDLGNFLSNQESKDMAKMEGIGKVERETTGSKVKEIVLEEEQNNAKGIVEHYIYYFMD